ncbi:Phytoene desaturase [Venturia nashicola]|nr:Phytoene desaturase [Venturia nashicola]
MVGQQVLFDGLGDSKIGLEGLPGYSDALWEKTSLGTPQDWPPSLRSFSVFINSLPNPAAIFWGNDLVLIYNDAWSNISNVPLRQGKAQNKNLCDQALSAIRTAMHGRTRRNLDGSLFLPGSSKNDVEYHALLSPIWDRADTLASGTVAQFFPRPSTSQRKEPEPLENIEGDVTAKRPSPTRRRTDEIPLDQHPFFQRFAAMLPTGLAILDHKAEAVFVNQQFYDLTTTPDSSKAFQSWPRTIHADDYERVMKAYKDAFKSGKQMECEFRCQGQNNPWRLLLLSPLGDDNLRQASLTQYGGFICAMVDISPQKAQELAQEKAAQEARNRKEQQERFIDMISHEIRNPLSACLHCAEDIIDTIDEGSTASEMGKSMVSVAPIKEAAETITLCVSHQKTLIDDILSFSKLDSSMLSLTPKSVQPKRQLADSLKMFQPELRKENMKFEYKVDYSYDHFHVDWVKADLVRISQVLVNLVTNSIKFMAKTKDREKIITVAVGASVIRPTSYPLDVVFFDADEIGYRIDGTNTSEWGNGEALYILCAVKDTGIGISTENQKKLFERFKQATPKTEEIYGGSGLGLNISRKLCQLHGGEIGVSAIEDEGSTFGFFFKVRRTEIPKGSTPPKNDRLMDTEIQDKMRNQHGDNAPIEIVQDGESQHDLNHPPMEHVAEAGVQKVKDPRWQHTADIAAKVDDETPGGEKRSSGRGPEDNIINQRILRRKLESKSFKVITANNGREAVEAVHEAFASGSGASNQSEAFDIILMDQEMPVMDGNAATKAIRKMEAKGQVSHIPILGVTANVREEQKNDMISAGMDDVISKPYGIGEMVDRIRGMLIQREE